MGGVWLAEDRCEKLLLLMLLQFGREESDLEFSCVKGWGVKIESENEWLLVERVDPWNCF